MCFGEIEEDESGEPKGAICLGCEMEITTEEQAYGTDCRGGTCE
jgi:hypothetical protein